MEGGREPVQLVLQEREALGDADQEDVDAVRRGVAGGEQLDGGGVGEARAGQVRAGGLAAQVGVGDLDEAPGGVRVRRPGPACPPGPW